MITDGIKNTMNAMSEALNKAGYSQLIDTFNNCYPNTASTTTELCEDGTTFVITGDIPAMWLRDSSAQVRHYLPLCKDDPEISKMIFGLIKRQTRCIISDARANAFNRTESGACWSKDDTEFDNPGAWERKYEIDSLCYPVQLAYLYMKASEQNGHIDNEFKKACGIIIDTFTKEQNHENSDYYFNRTGCPDTDTLSHNGKGAPVRYTGMTWSGFRPSDDACQYGYLIPSNMFASVILGYMTEMFGPDEISVRAEKLKKQIDDGIREYGIYDHPKYGKIYAYETDGFGNYTLMDDANVPSLLSIPYLGWCSNRDEIYMNTRKFILSNDNPYYYEGKIARGIGSPHTPQNYIWHISLAMQGLTSDDENEQKYLLDLFCNTTAGTGFMHEGFCVDDAGMFTRKWFAWANSIFSEFLIKKFLN